MKLKGYVLFESMVAMVLIMICFGIAIMIYNNVVSGNRTKLGVLARLRMENAAMKAKTSERLLDETMRYDEFDIEQKVIAYPNTAGLYELRLVAGAPGGKQLAEYHELLHRP